VLPNTVVSSSAKPGEVAAVLVQSSKAVFLHLLQQILLSLVEAARMVAESKLHGTVLVISNASGLAVAVAETLTQDQTLRGVKAMAIKGGSDFIGDDDEVDNF